MEDFYMNITSQDNSYDYSNITEYNKNIKFIIDVATSIYICIGLPLTLIAIYTLYSQIRKDHVAPIYIINLLISDIIQLCCLIVWVEPTAGLIDVISYDIYYSALVASVVFMVCIALERYLVIVHPLWYRFRRSIKISVGVCVLVWVLALVLVLIFDFWVQSLVTFIIFSIFLLLPLPLFIFFLVGTLKALSASISVPSEEKRRIVGVLVLVLLIYTLLFLPAIIWYLAFTSTNNFNFIFYIMSHMFLRLSPLADLILYIFMRKGTIDKFLSFVCCCRMDSDDTNSPSV